jgi:hypothetical protein
MRRIALATIAGAGLAVWEFPVIWGLLTSFKTERDVLAYPPVWLFKPTLDNYREVIFGASSIVPNLWSSLVVSTSATLLTMLFAVPAAYALARLRYPAKRASGFYVLATQMLPPVGLIIPYYLVLQKIGALDTYAGLTVISRSTAVRDLPMVSYFEDVRLNGGSCAARSRRAARALVHHPAAGPRRHRGDDDIQFERLNGFMPAVFGGTAAAGYGRMFTLISVEQTQWALAAGDACDGAGHPIGIIAQRHIVRPDRGRSGGGPAMRRRRTAASPVIPLDIVARIGSPEP